MKAVPQIIVELGDVSAVARALNVGNSTVSEMKRRGLIMPKYWVELVLYAHSIGALWLTHEYLSQVHALAKGRPVLEGPAQTAPLSSSDGDAGPGGPARAA